MPFDTTKPAPGDDLDAVLVRNQLNALNDKIDAVPAGPPGPPFASAVVDSVSTVPAGTDASVGVNFDGSNVRFTFAIPEGAAGADGTNGTNGTNGADGAPGEVTNAALAAAIAGTSSNSNGVALLGITVSDPPTQAEMQAIADKLDELITAQRR